MSWTKLKPKPYPFTNYCLCAWWLLFISLIGCSILLQSSWCILGTVAMLGIGVTYIATIRRKIIKIRNKSNLIKDFNKKNNLYQSYIETKRGLLVEKDIEVIEYYPQIEYSEDLNNNVFKLRFRLDGSAISMKFLELERPLANLFTTVCTDIIEERGYITYCFELCEQEQVRIESEKDIMLTDSSEIVFTENMKWNWRKCPHLLLTGNTGSGKTQTAQYIIACLLKQGVRVIYCDPKNDDDMRCFLMNKPVTYLTKENDIAKAVREIEEEVRLREQDINTVGMEEISFPPIFIMFDELIVFSKIADKRTYEETSKRLATIIVAGRSKCIYAGLILQRPDTSFIDGAVRESLCCKICMGRMSETAYKMSFGQDFAHVKNLRNEIGSGLILRDKIDSKPREFLAPFICKGALTTE